MRKSIIRHLSSKTKCLTVKQPWADLIMSGEKRIENRSWGKGVRGTIGIHRGGNEGAVLGTVEVVDVLPMSDAMKRFPEDGAYIQGPLCWILRNPRHLSVPLRCRGALSLWLISSHCPSQS